MGTGTGRKRRSRPIKRGEDREEKRWKNTARRAPAGLGLHKAFDAKLGSPQGPAKRRATPPNRQRGASAKPPPRPIPGECPASGNTPSCRREIFGRRPPADGREADSRRRNGSPRRPSTPPRNHRTPSRAERRPRKGTVPKAMPLTFSWKYYASGSTVAQAFFSIPNRVGGEGRR